ncbi:peroxisomal 2,4-dienoyl-CoA reductase [Cinnamomum micranthum f. kanehirae]|uniref:2,4-dienoyl-CoA reductase [(3E)-enoyl-CoA-producing] n=1 Tax=Cinnamomum micranthum f. kanehirae TaxID=337451 RepID=A0A443PCP1_9MAGN|nr:peroxisomal 2,4-dienoyl-CoA reductase [Cinnamomum micranthum f. kanehirae]
MQLDGNLVTPILPHAVIPFRLKPLFFLSLCNHRQAGEGEKRKRREGGVKEERSKSKMESPFKADILKGKVALLTGGGSGIGFELATQFGKHGAAAVAIMGRRKEVLDSAVSVLQSHGIQAIGFQGDVRKKEDAARVVDSTVEHFGRLDILVNGAAGNFLVPSEDLSPKGFRTVIDIDSVGTFTMCHAAFKYLKKGAPGRGPSSGGVILNISATLHYTASWYQIQASAAKVCQNIMLIVASSPPSSKPCPNYVGVCYHVHLCGIIFCGLFSMLTLLSFQQAAVDSITRSLALEWGTDYDIRVNGICTRTHCRHYWDE